MQSHPLLTRCAVALFVAATLTAAPAFADKGGKGKGGDRGDRSERSDDRDRNDSRPGVSREHGQDNDRRGDRGDHRDFRFADNHRSAVHQYYTENYRSGRCPPGLAKKHNGCMPPGQAKKWKKGYALPRDVVYYEVPRPLIVQLPPPPANTRYVRVASDILLIAIGTGMVIDAIQDLGGR